MSSLPPNGPHDNGAPQGQQPHGQQSPYGQQPQYGQQAAYGQHPGQPPYGAAPQPPKKKMGAGKVVMLVLVGLVVLIVGVSALSGGGDGDQAGGPGSNAAKGDTDPEAPALPALGDPVVVDDLEFTLTKFKCGVTVKDITDSKLKPQGQFCKVSVAVKNVGKSEEHLFDEAVKLLGDDENEFSPSSDTFFVKNALSWETINPGNTVKGVVYFDIPKDVEPKVAAVGGGLFSEPAEVALS